MGPRQDMMRTERGVPPVRRKKPVSGTGALQTDGSSRDRYVGGVNTFLHSLPVIVRINPERAQTAVRSRKYTSVQ